MNDKHYQFLKNELGVSRHTIDTIVRKRHSVLSEVLSALSFYLGDEDENANIAGEIIQELVDDFLASQKINNASRN